MGVGLTFALWNERLLMLREDPHSCWSPHYELRQPDNWELVHRLAAMEAAEECWHRREAAAIEVEEDLAYVTLLAESKAEARRRNRQKPSTECTYGRAGASRCGCTECTGEQVRREWRERDRERYEVADAELYGGSACAYGRYGGY